MKSTVIYHADWIYSDVHVLTVRECVLTVRGCVRVMKSTVIYDVELP